MLDIYDNEYLDFYFVDTHSKTKGLYNCNPSGKWSYGSNKSEPDFLSRCYFEKQVLDRYNRAGSEPVIHYDFGNEDYVMAYLWDLGYLSIEEQHHWKSYNIKENIEQYKISNSAILTDYYSRFPDPETHIERFKHLYESVNAIRHTKMNYMLWCLPKKQDQYKRDQLELPMYNTQDSFDEQCIRLWYILWDLLNSNDIKKYLSKKNISYDKDTKAITHLDLILQDLEYQDSTNFIKRLRSIWDLRHCVHQKWDDYNRWLKYFSVIEGDYIQSFKNIISLSITHLQNLENWLNSHYQNSK